MVKDGSLVFVKQQPSGSGMLYTNAGLSSLGKELGIDVLIFAINWSLWSEMETEITLILVLLSPSLSMVFILVFCGLLLRDCW